VHEHLRGKLSVYILIKQVKILFTKKEDFK
jgi:hypothetical protein